MRFTFSSAYTLVELLVAMVLSLFLLLGVLEMFRIVSGAMNEAQATLNMSANLDGAAMILRQDLARIPDTLPTKPIKIADPSASDISDLDGYLEITEGEYTASSHPFVTEKGILDSTVGDTDDIIGFTAKAGADAPFRGLINGIIAERYAAEIIWFMRGNTLYRRVRLIDDENSTGASDVNTIQDLARRERRFGHDGQATNTFPHPLYDTIYEGWRYLRMPTLEETLSADWKEQWKDESTIPNTPTEANPNLWNQPYFYPDLQDKKSGSLENYVDNPRHVRAGEDIILTNVLSFDIKVWNPSANEYVDLGQNNAAGTGFEKLGKHLPRTWDSWTQEYKENNGDVKPPPYAEPLTAIQITIRCFDPASKIVKQITVVHRFD